MKKNEALNTLSLKLIKESLEGFTGWHTEWDAITPNGEYAMFGNLSTNEGHLLGSADVTYFGCKFHLKVDNELANWYFEVKCDSEMYTFTKHDGTKDSGSNWSGCIIPDLWKPYDMRKKYKEEVEQAIYQAI